MNFTQAFATTLRTLRVERQLSQEELARRSGLHINSIGLLERELREPSLYTVFQLAIGLGIPVAQFVQAVEDRKPTIQIEPGPY